MFLKKNLFVVLIGTAMVFSFISILPLFSLSSEKVDERAGIPGDPYYAENKYYAEREAAVAHRDAKKRKRYQPPYATIP